LGNLRLALSLGDKAAQSCPDDRVGVRVVEESPVIKWGFNPHIPIGIRKINPYNGILKSLGPILRIAILGIAV
jgi:hypothetical protein